MKRTLVIVNEIDADASSKEPDAVNSVVVLTVDPEDPGQLTLSAVRALQAADIIVHDGAITEPVMELGRREANRIAVHNEVQAARSLSRLASGASLRIVYLRSSGNRDAIPSASDDSALIGHLS